MLWRVSSADVYLYICIVQCGLTDSADSAAESAYILVYPRPCCKELIPLQKKKLSGAALASPLLFTESVGAAYCYIIVQRWLVVRTFDHRRRARCLRAVQSWHQISGHPNYPSCRIHKFNADVNNGFL